LNLDRIDFWHSLAIAPKSAGGHLSDRTSDPGQPQKLAIVYPDLHRGFPHQFFCWQIDEDLVVKVQRVFLLCNFRLLLRLRRDNENTTGIICKFITNYSSRVFHPNFVQLIDFSLCYAFFKLMLIGEYNNSSLKKHVKTIL
jgi:hypothetical protein